MCSKVITSIIYFSLYANMVKYDNTLLISFIFNNNKKKIEQWRICTKFFYVSLNERARRADYPPYSLPLSSVMGNGRTTGVKMRKFASSTVIGQYFPFEHVYFSANPSPVFSLITIRQI